MSEAVSMMAQSGLVQVGGDSDIEGIEEEEGEEEVVEELVEASEEEDEAEAVLLEREKEANLQRHRSLMEERTKCFGVGISWNWLISICRNFRRKLKRLYRSNDRSLIL